MIGFTAKLATIILALTLTVTGLTLTATVSPPPLAIEVARVV